MTRRSTEMSLRTDVLSRRTVCRFRNRTNPHSRATRTGTEKTPKRFPVGNPNAVVRWTGRFERAKERYDNVVIVIVGEKTSRKINKRTRNKGHANNGLLYTRAFSSVINRCPSSEMRPWSAAGYAPIARQRPTFLHPSPFNCYT